MRDHLRKAPRAFVCGVLGSIVGWTLLWLLTEYAGWFYLVSAIVSIYVNVTFNFWINNVWTFRGADTGKRWLRRYAEFWATYGVGAGVDYGLLALFTSVVGIDYRVSWWIAISCVGFARYLGMYYWVWRRRYA